MSHPLLFTIKLAAAIGCGLVAGIFFAFSTFVMQALAQQPAQQAIAAMQSINITVINPWFMTAFLGTGFVCLFLIAVSLFNWQQSGSAFLLIGSIFYLVGTIGVTIAFNIPQNDALAIVMPNSPDGTSLWMTYLSSWTFWNHVRTLASLGAAALLAIGLNYRGSLS